MSGPAEAHKDVFKFGIWMVLRSSRDACITFSESLSRVCWKIAVRKPRPAANSSIRVEGL